MWRSSLPFTLVLGALWTGSWAVGAAWGQDGPSLLEQPAAADGPEVDRESEREPAPALDVNERNEAGLVMNFRDARLRTILEYISEQAGLAVVDGVQLDERVTVFNRQPMTVDETVNLLNTVLYEHGYAAIRRERVLRIVPLTDARRHSVPVRVGNDPAAIGQSDRIITQIIPVHFADAEALADNVRPLLSAEISELSANENSNALIVTDTEANIRRIVEITQALDQSMSQARDVRVFYLRYADAQETAQLITETFRASDRDDPQGRGPRGWPMQRRGGDENESGGMDREVRAAADRRGNSVVVSATPAALQLIARVIEDLDVDSSAQEAVFVYHANNASASELEGLFNRLFAEREDRTGGRQQQPRRGRGREAPTEAEGSAADLVGNVTAVADPATNSLLVLTAETNFLRIREILEELDRPVPQVLVRVLVAELSHTRARDIGFEFEGAGPVGEYFLQGLMSFGSPDGGMNFMVLHDDYSAAIHALETEGVLDVLSRPYILTRDNHEANILVGEEAPFVTNTRVTDVGTVINTIDYRDIGIILGVTPQINTEGMVVLDISQELSVLQESTVPISEELAAPLISKRTADTRIAVNSGQTVVIGGLMQDQLLEQISKIPFLGDIPVVGELFRRTRSERSKTELLLFLTPEVIMNPADLVEVSDRVQNEAEHIHQTVEPGALQRHLERMRVPESGEVQGAGHANE